MTAAASADRLIDDWRRGRRWHDMGGAAAGPISPSEHALALWEKRVDALMMRLSAHGVFTVDGLRRALEDMGPEAFGAMTYYERWMAATAQMAVESGLVTTQELAERMAQVAARGDSYGVASLNADAEAPGSRGDVT